MFDESKRLGIDKIIKYNEIINRNLSLKYKTTPSLGLNCKKDTENINPKVSKTSNGKIVLKSKCAICGSKN